MRKWQRTISVWLRVHVFKRSSDFRRTDVHPSSTFSRSSFSMVSRLFHVTSFSWAWEKSEREQNSPTYNKNAAASPVTDVPARAFKPERQRATCTCQERPSYFTAGWTRLLTHVKPSASQICKLHASRQIPMQTHVHVSLKQLCWTRFKVALYAAPTRRMHRLCYSFQHQ